MAQWVGYMVSIKCSDGIGTFQGEITAATNQAIWLIKAFCNGIPCPENKVTVRAEDILDLKLIDKQSSTAEQHSTVTIAKPIPKKANRTQNTSESINTLIIKNSFHGHSSKSKPVDIDNRHSNKSKPIDIDVKHGNHNHDSKHTVTETNSYNSYKNTPNKREKTNKQRWNKGRDGWKDEECFGSPLDSKINKDFDFEKNLALFDKQAVYEEINSQKPDVIKYADNKRTAKYRHDENVIPLPSNSSVICRQISVPKQDFCEYVTDDGLIIPSISRGLRKKLFEAAEQVGFSWERRAELMGRAATEMAIQLLGGGHRLNPQNSHQVPSVVIFVGPHKQGAVGLNAARQLASHGIQTIVFCVSSEAPAIKKELSLYRMTKNKVINSKLELPNFTDLIIVALCEDTENPKNYSELADWISKNRAFVLALDPPSCGTPGVSPKISLLPVLPLPHSPNNGKLYLANLGFPVEIFNEVGIKYKSPFGPKFFIPLHLKDD